MGRQELLYLETMWRVYNAMEDSKDDIECKLIKKGNLGAKVGAKWGVCNSTPLLRVVPSRPSLLVEGTGGL